VHRARAVGLSLSLVLVLGLLGPPSAVGATIYPALPEYLYGGFLFGISAPVLTTGSSGTVALTVGDPLPTSLSSVVVTLSEYAFNAYPGNSTGPVPSNGLLLSGAAVAGANVTLNVGAVSPGVGQSFSVAVAAPGGCPQGTFAIRTAIEFQSNGSVYRLESRGWFSAAEWSAATSGPGGTSTLNVTRLGVSGVVPETAVLVRDNPYVLPLYGILGVALIFAAAGGYYAFRRGPGSRAGARGSDEPSHAPSAFGKRRTRDGD